MITRREDFYVTPALAPLTSSPAEAEAWAMGYNAAMDRMLNVVDLYLSYQTASMTPADITGGQALEAMYRRLHETRP